MSQEIPDNIIDEFIKECGIRESIEQLKMIAKCEDCQDAKIKTIDENFVALM